MKKIASILTVFIGLILLVLNYQNTALESQKDLSEEILKRGSKTIPQSEEKAIDISNINLPSIFDALIHSL